MLSFAECRPGCFRLVANGPDMRYESMVVIPRVLKTLRFADARRIMKGRDLSA